MGILANGCTIFLGGVLGNALKRRVKQSSITILGVATMLISCIGVVENIFHVTSQGLESNSVVILALALLVGNGVGEALCLEERLQRVGSSGARPTVNAFLMSSVFFGIGGLQLSGSILLAVEADSSQLFLKSIIDFPFALAFGAAYGLGISASCIPVMLIQVMIALLAYIARPLFSDDAIRQLCAMGYIILFFLGYNQLVDKEHRFHTTNMMPSILLLILYHAVSYIVG